MISLILPTNHKDKTFVANINLFMSDTIVNLTLHDLEVQALRTVEAVRNNPEGRYALRLAFYQKYGGLQQGVHGPDGLGDSELAFLRWEINRGVLNPLNDPAQKGSLWWRRVNSSFIYYSTLAALIYEAGETFPGLEPPVMLWLSYIQEPSPKHWYRAHNSSITQGYLRNFAAVRLENKYEQYFVNIVLYRLLFAQAMVEGVEFGRLGQLLADPSGSAVSLICDIQEFYPTKYPIAKQDFKYILHKGHNLFGIFEDILDQVIILPQLNRLYDAAAQWNDQPATVILIQHGVPAYPEKVPVSPDQWLANLIFRILHYIFKKRYPRPTKISSTT